MSWTSQIARSRARLIGFAAPGVLGVLGLAASCTPGGGDPFRLPDRTPVVLIMVDTLRADRLHGLGYELETSPVLDEFARTAWVFENNTPQCNSTLPSITSTLSSLYVKTHRNYISVPIPGLVRANTDRQLLQERLGAEGYYSLTAFSHPSWREDRTSFAVARGWDETSWIPNALPNELRMLLGHGAYTNKRLFGMLANYEARTRREDGGYERPLFMLAHYFDPHTDLPHNMYNASEAYRNEFLLHHLERLGLEEYHDVMAPLAPLERHQWMVDNLTDKRLQSRLTLAVWRSMYDAEILSFNDELQRLFDRLKVMGIHDDALIVVMADHGENMEPGSRTRGQIAFSHQRLFEGVAHTPLMIRLPGQTEGGRIDALTQNIDVMPTVLELLGLEPQAGIEGKSLVPLMRDPTARVHDIVFIESVDHVERAVKSDSYKYIHRGDNVPPLVFRWREDPREHNDVASEVPENVLTTFEELLDGFKSKTTLRLRLVPEDAPYEARIELQLASSKIEKVVGARDRVPSKNRSVFRHTAKVEDHAVDIFLVLDRRNTRATWKFTHSNRDDLTDTVFLGQFPVARSAAFPILRATGAPAPSDPVLRVTRRKTDSTTRIDLAHLAGTTCELDVRFSKPSPNRRLDLVDSKGFGALDPVTGFVSRLTLAEPAERASALLSHERQGGDLELLPRIDGRWPDLARVELDGHAVRRDQLEVVVPFPLDARITTLLLAGPPAEEKPGSIIVWLETGGDSQTEIDTSLLTKEEIEELRTLGYVK